MKKVLIAVAGSEGQREYKDVQLLPGAKARDVLEKLGLRNLQLSRPEGGAIGFDENLYNLVSEGQKLFATPANVEAGA